MQDIRNAYQHYAEELYRDHPGYFEKHKTWFQPYLKPRY